MTPSRTSLRSVGLIAVLLFALAFGGCNGSSSSHTIRVRHRPTATPTRSGGATPTATPTAHGTSSSTGTPTATATPLATGLNKVNHIIIAMQENHSFDSYFGALPYAPGLASPAAGATPTYHPPTTPGAACDPNDHRCVDGLTCSPSGGNYNCTNSNVDCILANTDGSCIGATTNVVSFHDNNYCPAPDLDHSWDPAHREANFTTPNGALASSPNDGFARVNDQTEQKDIGESPTEDDTMGFYNESDLAFYYGLAQAFAIDDRYFCSLIGPTTPNRAYLQAATSFGHLTTSVNELAPTPGTVYKPITGTILDLMNNANVTWADYFTDLPTAGFYQMPSGTHFRPISQFFIDAAAGNLPQVVYVDPQLAGLSDNAATDEHPPHDIRAGQFYMNQIVSAVRSSPNWKDSILIITYDEHGGFYDHVMPPAASQGGKSTPEEGFPVTGVPGLTVAPAIPPGQCADLSSPTSDPTTSSTTPGNGQQCTDSSSIDAPALCPAFTKKGPYPSNCATFNQLGFRVPFIAVSPFSKPSYVSHAVGDHTSLMALIEKRFLNNQHVTNRDANADDLEDMFDFSGSGPSLNVNLATLPTAPAPNLATDGNGDCAASPTASATMTPTATPTP